MLKRPTFLKEYARNFQERQAARMRLPAWLAVLMPIMVMSSIVAVTGASMMVLWKLHSALHPGTSPNSGIAGGLMMFPTFFGSMPPALMLLNLILVRIPPLRRIFDKNSEGVPGLSYREAMGGLRKLAMILVPPALALSLIGAIEPWAF